MKYFWKGFKDPKYWLKITVLPAVGGLCLLDFLSYAFAPPGYLNLWAVKITGVLGAIALVVYGFYLYIKPKHLKQLTEAQVRFEKRREAEMKWILRENPEFQTLCYECRYFDQEWRACTLEIIDQRATRVRLGERFRYCLYWEKIVPPGEQASIQPPPHISIKVRRLT